MKKENIKLLSQIKILVIFLLLFAYIPLIFAQGSGTDRGASEADTNQILEAFKENDLVRIIFGNPGESLEGYDAALIGQDPQPLSRTSAITIHLCFWAIFFVAFSDIFGTFLPFTNKIVPWIVGGAFTIAFANLGFIPWIVVSLAKATAGLGAISVIASMGIAFIGFIAVTYGGAKLKYLILKGKHEYAGKSGADDAKRAIENLKTLEKGFEKGH